MGSNTVRLLALLIFAFVIASCSGKKNNNNPPPGNTGLTLQLNQDAANRVGAGTGSLTGATVTAISTGTGAVAATGTVNASGSLNFSTLAAGSYLLRVNFPALSDLDGDGTVDTVDLLLPVTVPSGNSTGTLMFTGLDLDGDGVDDAIQLTTNLSGSAGQLLNRLQRLDLRNRLVGLDDNNNGVIDPNELRPDVNNDLLPDLEGAQNSLHGGVLHGSITAVNSSQLTVQGINFTITDSTRFRLTGNGSGTIAQFPVGTNVLVRGFWNGTSWIATEVKQTGDGTGTTPVTDFFAGIIGTRSDTALTIGDNSFTLNANTVWTANGSTTTDLDLFDPGDIVLVRATWNGTAWVVSNVTLLSNLVADDGGSGPFTGTITAVTATSITINGQVYTIDTNTALSSQGVTITDLGLFDVGDVVSIDATVNGTTNLATAIRLTTNNVADTSTLSGVLTSLGTTEIQFADQTITLDANTVFNVNGSATTDVSQFVLGNDVTVNATWNGMAWVATSIDLAATPRIVVNPGDTVQTYTGAVSAINATSLSIPGYDYVVDANTVFVLNGQVTTDTTAFTNGDNVTVLGRLNGTTWTALAVLMNTDQ